MRLTDPQKKALLEGARLMLITLVSYLLTDGVLGTIVAVYGKTIDPTQQILLTGFLTTCIKSLDKYLHENGDPGTGLLGEKGLVGF